MEAVAKKRVKRIYAHIVLILASIVFWFHLYGWYQLLLNR